MKDSTRSSFAMIGIGLFMIAFSIMLISLAITQWDAWIAQLKPMGMTIVIIISIVIIIIGVILIIKFVT